jgi:prevent-host-death family protein
MITVSIKQARDRLAALARSVEKGQTVTVTRNGKPVLDLVPHNGKGGLSFAAGEAYLRKHRVKLKEPRIAEDLDEPLPEDFLLRPLPDRCDCCSTPTFYLDLRPVAGRNSKHV